MVGDDGTREGAWSEVMEHAGVHGWRLRNTGGCTDGDSENKEGACKIEKYNGIEHG